MPFDYNVLQQLAQGDDGEEQVSPAASLRFYDMVSISLCTRMPLTAA